MSWRRGGLAVLFVCALLPIATGCGTPAPSDVVVTWEGGSITRAEAQRYIQFLQTRRLRTGSRIDVKSGLTEILSDLAWLKITAAEVEEADPDPPVLYLDREGAALVRYYVGKTGKRSHQVTDEEAMAAYEEGRTGRFTLPESITFRHVFLRADRRSKEELARVERTVLDALAAGTPFGKVASSFSESETARREGTVGPVFRGRMDAAFEEKLYQMTPKRTGVVRMPQGTHVVEVLEKRPSRVMPFEEVKTQIVSAIMDRRNDVEREELMKTLRARYGVLDRTDDPAAGPDDVVLRVRDRQITRKQLDAYVERRTARAWSRGKDPKLRRRWVDDLVRSNLLYLEAVASGMDKEEAFLDRRELRRLTLRSARATEKRFGEAGKKIPDEEVLRYWRENPGRFAVPGRSRAVFIFLPFGGVPPFELEQRLEELAKLAQEPDADPVEVSRRCDEAGAIYVDMGWATSRDAAWIAPEFQRRFIAQKAPGSTGVFKVEEGLFVILVRAVEGARPMKEPEDHEAIREQYLDLRKTELLRAMKDRDLKERNFTVLSTDVFQSPDEKS